ncbi:PfkB family carbohydrate kinase [Leifsonia sp. 2MCAF36]|uniref:PfkB family carbohydrate kinase n=1 Tax=Leifsonia sp. 2MCAF36 TaxID=3232988 RepID=UPI003F9E5943
MSEPYVCVVGDALIDELQTPAGVEEHVGGAGLNVAVGLRRLGLETSLAAMVGEDRAGDDIRAHLTTSGVALHATAVPVSARAVSDRRHGEPRYVFNDAARTRHIAFDPQQRSALAGAALVVVSSFPFDDVGQARLLSEAIEDPGSRLVLDPNPRAHLISDLDAFRAGFESLAARSLLVKIGDEDAQLLYGESLTVVARRLLGLGPSAVLATAGAAGASLSLATGETAHSPVHPLPGPIVDTMGAGDATLASITSTLARDGLPETPAAASVALHEAMAIAAATCRVPGALLRLPPVAAAE